jgi:membrane-associated phospholipid phosphatase
MFWQVLTNFGDAAAMLPAAAAIAAWLAAGRAWRAVVVWMLVLALASAAVIATKIAFLGWGIGIRSIDFTGFSGHSLLATAVMGIGARLSVQGRSDGIRLLALLLGFAAGIAVGVSRVALEFHSPSEAIAGCLLGICTGVCFVRWSEPLPPPVSAPMRLGAALLLLLLVIHGQRAPTQQWIASFAIYMSGHAEPYTRTVWAEPGRS